MEYRLLGRTGLKVSELGFGGHEYRRWLHGQRNSQEFIRTQLERNRLVEKAMDAGVNYFDTTFDEETESLGLALKELGRREEIHVAAIVFKLFDRMAKHPTSEWRQITMEDVEHKMTLLYSDYIDVITIIGPGDGYFPRRLTAAIVVFEELKERETIGSIGASSHQLRFLAELMRRYKCFDTIMVTYNYCQQEARDIVFPLAKTLEVGVVAMKPFAWPYYGIPFMRFGPTQAEAGPFTPGQTSLRWILNSPEVATVVPSMNSLAELEENLAAFTKEGRAYEKVLDQHLGAAQSPQAMEKLREMLKDPAIDISHYARQALGG